MPRPRLWFAASVFVSAFFLAPSAGAGADVDMGSCLAEPMPSRQIACLSKAAITADDPDLCLEAELPAIRWPCVALYADYADDPSLCRILPESEDVPASVSRDLCRVHLAISRREAAFCEGLSTPNLSDGCFYQLVETGGDPALCERIANPEVKTVCGFYPETAE